jgi:hypothetical protein
LCPPAICLGVINRTIVPSLVDYDPCALSRVPITPSRLTEKKEVMRAGRHRKREFIEMRGDGLAVEVVIDSHVVPASFTNYLIKVSDS